MVHEVKLPKQEIPSNNGVDVLQALANPQFRGGRDEAQPTIPLPSALRQLRILSSWLKNASRSFTVSLLIISYDTRRITPQGPGTTLDLDARLYSSPSLRRILLPHLSQCFERNNHFSILRLRSDQLVWYPSSGWRTEWSFSTDGGYTHFVDI